MEFKMAVHTLLTEEQFLNLPDSDGRQEFRDGEVISVPPAKYARSVTLSIVSPLEKSLFSD